MRHHVHTNDPKGRLITGVIIVIVGLLFLLNNLNILPPRMEHYIFSWKTLLIAIGALNLLISHNRVGGFILITVGVVFWIPEIFDLSIHAGRFVWPLAIMAIGFFLLFNHKENKFGSRFWEGKIKHYQGSYSTENSGDQSNFSQDDYIDNVAIFGGGERIVTSKNFKGGKLTAIFGGSEIRMHQAKLAPGNHVLDVFFMFGGSEITVPADWTINVDVISIFGGFSDKRYARKPEETTETKSSVLTIKGMVLFGGGELKSY